MADQKLTQRDEVTDSNGEDIIHVVKDGVSYKQSKANFLSGIKAYSPSDVSAVWTGTGLVFDVTADSYQVSGKSYSSTAGQVTLDVADATLDRIDLIVAIAPVFPDIIGTVGKISGTPATLDLVVPPDYDPTLVFPIKQVTVKANSGVPFQTTKEIVFNEGTEWTTTLPASYSLVADDFYTGAKSIYATSATIPDKLLFKNSTPLNSDEVDLLEFYIKLDNVNFNYTNLVCQFQFAGALVGRVSTYIIEPSPNDWKRIQINKEQLALLGGTYDELVFYCSAPSVGASFWIDNISLYRGSGADDANLNISQFVNDVPYARLSDLTGSDYSEWATYSGTRAGGDLVVTIGDYDGGGNGNSIEVDDANNIVKANSFKGFEASKFIISNDSGNSTINNPLKIPAVDYIFTLPDASGTIALEADASGFNGNLTPSDTTLQAVAQKFDDYISTVDGYVTLAGDNEFTGANTFGEEVSFLNDILLDSTIISGLSNGINPTDAVNKGQLDAATPYQTPTQLLTAIKTVDGTGSGLDADFIDGLDSSRFLRSDAVDTATGDLTFNGSNIFQGDINIANADGIEMTGRQITGLQDGSNPTDAVNKSQLDATRPYKVYTALITQTGTAAPTAVVLENTLGGVPLWERTGVGNYTATLTSAFTLNKTIVFVTGGNTVNNASGFRFDENTVYLTSNNSTSLEDGLTLTSIEIRVYN